jgi:hypothetical protein
MHLVNAPCSVQGNFTFVADGSDSGLGVIKVEGVTGEGVFEGSG